MTTKITYKITCRLHRIKHFDGALAVEDNTVGYLFLDGGYYQISLYESHMTEHQYKQHKDQWDKFDGMPWYCRMKEGSIEVHKVTTTTTITQDVVFEKTDV